MPQAVARRRSLVVAARPCSGGAHKGRASEFCEQRTARQKSGLTHIVPNRIIHCSHSDCSTGLARYNTHASGSRLWLVRLAWRAEEIAGWGFGFLGPVQVGLSLHESAAFEAAWRSGPEEQEPCDPLGSAAVTAWRWRHSRHRGSMSALAIFTTDSPEKEML